jgi:hypothetical protein
MAAKTVDYLILDSETEHRVAVARIDAVFVARAVARGHRIDAGGVIPKSAETGEDREDAARWTTWEEPAPRATDGRFPCRHPRYMSVAADVTDAPAGRTALDDAMAGLQSKPVEAATKADVDAWWPEGREAAAVPRSG